MKSDQILLDDEHWRCQERALDGIVVDVAPVIAALRERGFVVHAPGGVDAERALSGSEAISHLTHLVKYAIEDHATTRGVTRLARGVERARVFLGRMGIDPLQVTATLDRILARTDS